MRFKKDRVAVMPDTASSLSASKDRLRLWLRFLKASRKIEAQLRDRMRAEFGTTLPRFDVMAALDRSPDGLKMSELSKVLRVSNGNITGIVDRLVEDGLAERKAVPGDRRASRVGLTKLGHKQFAALASAHEAWIDDMLSDFSADEAVMFATRLNQLHESLAGNAAGNPDSPGHL